MPEQPRQEDIDELMKVLAGSAAAHAPAPEPPPRKETAVRPSAPAAAPEPESPAPAAPRAEASLDFLADVDVQVRVELGNSKLNVKDVLRLGPGSVVGLDSLVGDPVNVFVNDRLVARGEVLVVHDNFAIRITEVVPPPKSVE
ncbi:MAG TPA: flagellar motor switch protein FliN [Planctomycetota bacterium]|jgi:flagellar motor switch protein FliN|nr:flagellar motor switch protein FliN [Planctomycetota bacterium]